MHRLSPYILPLIFVIIASIHSFPVSEPSGNDVRQQHQHESQLYEANIYDDDDYTDESHESICESAIEMIVNHPNIDNLNPSLLLSYCPHFKERLALIMKNKTTANENSDSNSDDAEKKKKKKRTLRKRQLKKQFALKFIRKSVP